MYFMTLTFIFFVGSICGWILEYIFRNYIKREHQNKKVNPGFCKGPYLPIYGFGFSILYLLTRFWDIHPVFLFIIMGISLTLLEYLVGIILLKGMNTRLWDYQNEWKNMQGIICPKYSFAWFMMSFFYYYFIHPILTIMIDLFLQHPTFLFIVGMFYGILLMDVIQSSELLYYVKKYALEHKVIIQFEKIKSNMLERYHTQPKKFIFFHSFDIGKNLIDSIQELKEEFERLKKKE